MKRFISTLFATAALAALPLAAPAHPVMDADGVLRFAFIDKQVPSLFCRPLYVCDLILEPGEKVLNLAIGDSVRWVLSEASSGTKNATPHILLKPADTNLSTNLIVTTDKRAYYVDLHSANVQPMLRVGFFFPTMPDATATAASAGAGAAMHDGMAATDAPPAESLDFAYEKSGSRELFPTSAYNDGKHTYLRLDPRVPQLPVLFAIGPDGDQLINYRVKDGNTYIVDGIPDRIALIVGSGKHLERATLARKS